MATEAFLARLLRESDGPGYESAIKQHQFHRHAECRIGIPSTGRSGDQGAWRLAGRDDRLKQAELSKQAMAP